MFYFVNFQGDPTSQSYDQGILFEKLVKKIVDALGFRVTAWRERLSGKEYDIRAKAKLGGRMLIGEAKARREHQAMPVISAFVGSLDHEDLPDDAVGLFISISDLSPDAREWLSKNKKKERIVTVVGQDIFRKLVEIGYPSPNQVQQWAATRFGMRTGDTYLLVSDRGDYFIQTLARRTETRVKAFCIYDQSGTLIDEPGIGKELKGRIEDLQELMFLAQPAPFQIGLDDTPGRIGGDQEGAGWFEHKLPAPPECFVGREKQLRDFQSFVSDVTSRKTNLRIYQVLSPSGVGKSSFVVKLQREVSPFGITVLQDARNIRGALDILALLQEFAERGYEYLEIGELVPSERTALLSCFPSIDAGLSDHARIGFIFVDQFESLFNKPDLYAAFLDMALEVVHQCRNIIFCIARKNDQPTTYEDRDEISLQRLRQISRSTELGDFSSIEAVELISHLGEEIGQPLKPRLHDMILEFSGSGFPWLVKRMGAHVRDMVLKHKRTQEALIQDGVKPDELFEEDLAELDIADREFLKELAHYLPATLDELGQVDKFRGKILTHKLRLFQDQRLVRLIGRTYDTYNDVFKYYLKHGEVPHPNKFTFRSPPHTTRKLMLAILENRPSTTEEVRGLTDLEPSTVPNILRELRMLGLVDYSRGQLTIDDAALHAYKVTELDALLKERVWKHNGLVSDILNRIAVEEKELQLEELIRLMKQSLPVLELSEDTWDAYARTMTNWLRFVGLTRPGSIVADGRALGVTRRGQRSGYFLPSAYIREIIKLANKFKNAEQIPGDQLEEKARFDCTTLGLIELIDRRMYQLTPLGQDFVSNPLVRPRVVGEFIADLDYVEVYLRQIEAKSTDHLTVLKRTLGDTAFTDETWIWRSKLLVNWLVFAGLVERRSGRISRSRQISFIN